MGFGDWLGNLFSPGETKGEYQQLLKYTPEQMDALNRLLEQAKTGMEGPAPSSPDAYVPTTQSEADYLDWARTDASKYARGGLPYEVGDQYVNEYMAAYKPVWERARNEALDLARAEYAGPSYWGSARAKGMSDIATDWGQKYAMQEAQLRLDQDKARREAIDKYIGTGTAGLTTAAGIERNVAEQRTMSDLNKFLRGEEVGGQYDPAYNINTQLSLALLGISPYEYGAKQETQGPGAVYAFTFPFGGGSGGTQVSSGILGALA